MAFHNTRRAVRCHNVIVSLTPPTAPSQIRPPRNPIATSPDAAIGTLRDVQHPLTYFTAPTNPAATSWVGHTNPAVLQGAITRAYTAADLTPPVLLDPGVDQAIMTARNDLREAIADLLADGQRDPLNSVLEAASATAKLEALDQLATQRKNTASARALEAFQEARTQAYAVDLLDAVTDVVDTISSCAEMLSDVADPFDLQAIVRAGVSASAWTDLVDALGRLSDLAALDGNPFRWIDVPTPTEPLRYDQWGTLLDMAYQDDVNAAVYTVNQAREDRSRDHTNAPDDDHLIVALAAGEFAPLALSFTPDDPEVARRQHAWNDALKGRKLDPAEHHALTGRKPSRPVVSPASYAFTHAS